MDVDFQTLADLSPSSILLPEVNRPFRAGIEPLTYVQQVTDLPSRFLCSKRNANREHMRKKRVATVVLDEYFRSLQLHS